MRKKQPGLGVDDDWEVTHDVCIRKPLGVVLSIHLDHLELDQISRTAESLGLTSLAFIREAALLVANDPSLRDRLFRSVFQEQQSGFAPSHTADTASE